MTKIEPPHKRLRECLRHYSEFKALVSNQGREVTLGRHVLECRGLRFSFFDLQKLIHEELPKLSLRKRQAIYYNVLCDEKQADVADRMGITTVSVGQYVDAGMKQLAEGFFTEEELAEYNRIESATAA